MTCWNSWRVATPTCAITPPTPAINPYLAAAVAAENEAIDFWLYELVCIGAEGADDLAEAAQVARRYLLAAGDCIGSRFLGPFETRPTGCGRCPSRPTWHRCSTTPSSRSSTSARATASCASRPRRRRPPSTGCAVHAVGSLGMASRTTSTIVDARQAERAALLTPSTSRSPPPTKRSQALDECQRELRILEVLVLATQQPQWVTILSEPGRAVVQSVAAALHATAASVAPVPVFDPTLALVDAAEAGLLDELARLATGRQIIVLT